MRTRTKTRTRHETSVPYVTITSPSSSSSSSPSPSPSSSSSSSSDNIVKPTGDDGYSGDMNDRKEKGKGKGKGEGYSNDDGSFNEDTINDSKGGKAQAFNATVNNNSLSVCINITITCSSLPPPHTHTFSRNIIKECSNLSYRRLFLSYLLHHKKFHYSPHVFSPPPPPPTPTPTPLSFVLTFHHMLCYAMPCRTTLYYLKLCYTFTVDRSQYSSRTRTPAPPMHKIAPLGIRIQLFRLFSSR